MMLDPRKVGELVSHFGPHDAAGVILVAAGLKNGGGAPIALFRGHRERTQSLLAQWGLSQQIVYGNCNKYTKLDKLDAEWTKLRQEGYEPQPPEYLENFEFRITIPNAPLRIIYWNKQFSRPPGKLNSDEEIGDFCGYPQCCRTEYAGQGGLYLSQLWTKILEQGISSAHHQVGCFHVPCSLDCEATRELGHADYLERATPYFYDLLRRIMVDDARDFASTLRRNNPQAQIGQPGLDCGQK